MDIRARLIEHFGLSPQLDTTSSEASTPRLLLRTRKSGAATLELAFSSEPARDALQLALVCNDEALLPSRILSAIAAQLEERWRIQAKHSAGLELEQVVGTGQAPNGQEVLDEDKLDEEAQRFEGLYQHLSGLLDEIEAGTPPFAALALFEQGIPAPQSRAKAPAAEALAQQVGETGQVPNRQEDSNKLESIGPQQSDDAAILEGEQFRLEYTPQQLCLSWLEPISSESLEKLRQRWRRRFGIDAQTQGLCLIVEAPSAAQRSLLRRDLELIHAMLRFSTQLDEVLGHDREPDPQQRYDLRLYDQGYDPHRVHQVVSLLLSVDVVRAAELCDNTPCTILVDANADQAFSMLSVLRRGGARVALIPHSKSSTP
ncbi:MAG: hypothetical protein RBU37_20320 [Myxococcota bacterium]|jgi:hypothetical protein|nr:hypothetical protein [Myxococcota bacterium]